MNGGDGKGGTAAFPGTVGTPHTPGGSAPMPSPLPKTAPHPPAPMPSRPDVRGGPPSTVLFPVEGTVLRSPRGDYRVGRRVGQGAYGSVYDATGPFDQRYAIKLLVPAMRPYVEVQTEWKKETERLLLLRHPNVVFLYDAFEADHLFYLALEWCSQSLKDMLVGPFEPALAIEITRQLLAAVQYLHDNDIVHDDLHAGNVLLTGDLRPVVKLADFGISQELQAGGTARPQIVHHAIMAPEVVSAGYTSRQSDIYQVGLLLYWMITSMPPVDYDVPYAELVKQVENGVARARAEALGTPIGGVIAKMLRRREAYRYGSAREVWEDLRKLPEWREGQAYPVRLRQLTIASTKPS